MRENRTSYFGDIRESQGLEKIFCDYNYTSSYLQSNKNLYYVSVQYLGLLAFILAHCPVFIHIHYFKFSFCSRRTSNNLPRPPPCSQNRLQFVKFLVLLSIIIISFESKEISFEYFPIVKSFVGEKNCVVPPRHKSPLTKRSNRGRRDENPRKQRKGKETLRGRSQHTKKRSLTQIQV